MVRLSSGTRPSSGLDFADIADIAAAVMRGVRIEDLAPLAGKRHADAVVVIDIRRKIHDHQASRARIVALAHPGEHVAAGVVGDDPFEAGWIAIQLVQRRQRAIEPVEVADQRLDAGMFLLLEQMPVERTIVVPLALLAELAAHEHQLLAGMSEHEAVIGAQIGKALPVVAGHAAEDRALAVHDLVMRQRQDEIFRERVVQAEQDVAVVIFAVDRILADIFQRVVHPAHVPFVAEAEPAIFDRARHLRPCGGFFRGRGGLRKAGKHFGIEAAQEIDRFEIFPAAIFVRNPAAGGPAVVEIEHGGDRIDAQAVDGVALQPEQRVRHQEIDDFIRKSDSASGRLPSAVQAPTVPGPLIGAE